MTSDQPRGTGTARGTFGELLQGVLPDRLRHFLVTLPIMRASTAEFAYAPDATAITVFPPDKLKSARLAELTLAHLGVGGGGTLTVRSDLPAGKGLASSSADLVATARAIGDALGMRLGTLEIERLLREIEPSDGVMYSGTVAFYHREVRLRQRMGQLPPLTIVGLDEGGVVDTIDFNNRVTPRFSRSDQYEYARLLDTLAAGIRAEDCTTIGRVATVSALRNQTLCPKRTLPAVLEICQDVGGIGVVAAHSGTMLGVLLDERDPAYADRLPEAVLACSALGTVSVDHSERSTAPVVPPAALAALTT